MFLIMCLQNGYILAGLALWKRNVDKRFEGVDECMICFSVIHGTTAQVPKLQCRTCKKRYHSACLVSSWWVVWNVNIKYIYMLHYFNFIGTKTWDHPRYKLFMKWKMLRRGLPIIFSCCWYSNHQIYFKITFKIHWKGHFMMNMYRKRSQSKPKICMGFHWLIGISNVTSGCS